MSEFTLYSYQCCPIRPDIPNNNNEEIFPDELEKADRKALDNMNVHQGLIDKILTADLYRHFENKIGFVSPERRYEAPTVARPPQM